MRFARSLTRLGMPRCGKFHLTRLKKEEGPWQAKNHGPSIAPTAPSALGVVSIAELDSAPAAAQSNGRRAPDGEDHHGSCWFWDRQGRAAAETCSSA
jgi:hypothetical protein